MAPPPSSAFVPPIVPPARLPGGAAAPTVVPASAFTSGSGAAVTAASGPSGDRKTTAPSRGRSRRKTVASAGRPSSKRPSSQSRGGPDGAAGGGDKTSTVVRAPASRASAGGAGAGSGNAAGMEQPPTAAAVADVLSALVALLSPATAAGAAFETEASSAAKIPAQPVTLAQMMSPTPGQSPLEAAAAMLASTAEAAPSGKAAMEVPKGAVAPPRAARTVTPPKEFTLPELLAPTPAQSPLEAAASLLAAAAQAAPSGKAATETPTPVKPLLSPPAGASPLDVAASRLAPAPAQETKPADGPSSASYLVPCTGPTAAPTVSEMLDASPARTPLEAAASKLQSVAQQAPSGKAAVEAPPHLRDLLTPVPGESPLELTARRLEAGQVGHSAYPAPRAVVDAPVKPKEVIPASAIPAPSGPLAMPTMAELLAPPSADTPLEMAASNLRQSAERSVTGKAATEHPSHLEALLHPSPSVVSPLEQAAEALFPVAAPVADSPAAADVMVPCTGPSAMPTLSEALNPPAADTPLEKSATLLAWKARLDPSGKAAMASPAGSVALLRPQPSMDSPLEQTANTLFPTPVVQEVKEPETVEDLLAPPAARTPLEAAATVLERSALLAPSGKAAMESPALMATLLHPTPSLESPLERTAEAMYTAPVVEAPAKKVVKPTGPMPMPTMEQLRAPPAASTPLESAATMLERSALLAPSGKAAMTSRADMATLLHPTPSLESPLERTAEAMYVAPVVEAPAKTVKPTGPMPMPTMEQLLAPPAASTPLESAATVLERSALLAPSGKASMASPAHMAALLHPTPSLESPLERTAESMYTAPVVEAPVKKVPVRAGLQTMAQLLAPPAAASPLEASAAVLQRSAELHPSGKAAMGSPAHLVTLLHPTPSLESPLERVAEAMYTAPVVEAPVEKVAVPTGPPTMEQLLAPPVASTPLEASATVLERSAELHPSGMAAMASPADMEALMNPKPSLESPLERVAEAMYTAPVVEQSSAKKFVVPSSQTPLQASASVLHRSAELAPTGKAAMASPVHMKDLMNPKPSLQSPLERIAESMFVAPVADKPVVDKAAAPVGSPSMEQLLTPPAARTPLEAAASVLQRSAELAPTGKAAMASPAQLAALMNPVPSMDSPLERRAEAMFPTPTPTPVEVKPAVVEVAPATGLPTMAELLAPPAAQTPLEIAASRLQLSAERAPTGKAAMSSPDVMTSLMNPTPSMDSPLERTAEAMYLSPVAQAPVVKRSTAPAPMPTMAQLLAPPPADTPLEAAATVLQRSAELAPSGKAAMAPSVLTGTLLNPTPSMESPLERRAEAMYPTPAEEATEANQFAPKMRTPLQASAAVLERSALLDTTGKASMAPPVNMAALLHPTPSMESPLERTAESMYTAPEVVLPAKVFSPNARTPLQASAAVLERSALLDTTGKAAMAPPPNMAALMRPTPSMESPLERTAEALFPAPVVDESSVKKTAVPAELLTMEQLLSPPPAATPLEAAASVLQRSAELHPSGKAAMASPGQMEALMKPKPFMESPLERVAEAMYSAPVVEAPAKKVVQSTGPMPMPTMEQLLAPPPARTPLESAATVLERSALLSPSGKAAMASPAHVAGLMHPTPSTESPLERIAEAMYTAPAVQTSAKKMSVPAGSQIMAQLLAPPPTRSPLDAAASVLQRSAELDPSGKAAMVSPVHMQQLLNPKPSMESPLERTAEAMFPAPVVEAPVDKPTGPMPMPTMEQLLAPPPARTPLEAAATVLERSAQLAPSGKAAMGSHALISTLMHPTPSMESPIERTAEAMFPALVVEEPVHKEAVTSTAPATMKELLAPPAADTPLEAAASVLQRSADLHPSGKAAMFSPAHVNALMNPAPSMESPLERRAEAMFPAPVVIEPLDKASGPAVLSPIDAAASVLEHSAGLAPSGKAAMAEPTILAALLQAQPSMDSPLEQVAQRLIPTTPAPVVEAPAPIISEPLPSSGPTSMPTLSEFLHSEPAPSPLEMSAAALERSAVLDPSGKSAMAAPTSVSALLHPEPNMGSPLERTAEAMFSAPAVKAPVGMNGATRVSRSPVDAAASVLQRSADLDPSGKAAMSSPLNVATLLHPLPSMESPLEVAARGLIPPAPVVAAPAPTGSVVTHSSGPTSVPTLAEFLDSRPAQSPLEAAATLLARSADEAPTGKAAMDQPPRLRDLLSPPPADSPLEVEARRLSGAPRSPAMLPDFVTAAMTGKAEPSRPAKVTQPAAEEEEDKKEVAAPGWRSSVPPAGAAAFVVMVALGIYMAMSQGVAAVIAAVLPNK